MGCDVGGQEVVQELGATGVNPVADYTSPATADGCVSPRFEAGNCRVGYVGMSDVGLLVPNADPSVTRGGIPRISKSPRTIKEEKSL